MHCDLSKRMDFCGFEHVGHILDNVSARLKRCISKFWLFSDISLQKRDKLGLDGILLEGISRLWRVKLTLFVCVCVCVCVLCLFWVVITSPIDRLGLKQKPSREKISKSKRLWSLISFWS